LRRPFGPGRRHVRNVANRLFHERELRYLGRQE